MILCCYCKHIRNHLQNNIVINIYACICTPIFQWEGAIGRQLATHTFTSPSFWEFTVNKKRFSTVHNGQFFCEMVWYLIMYYRKNFSDDSKQQYMISCRKKASLQSSWLYHRNDSFSLKPQKSQAWSTLAWSVSQHVHNVPHNVVTRCAEQPCEVKYNALRNWT